MILHLGLVFYTIIDIFSNQNKPAKKIINIKIVRYQRLV